ncbi:hypothetical protein [Pacificibacter sp. AS14]|uniref:hypothetical protein n=1 Tax=Pacificibacter sp. AS14 TaxID=3135785 RepID=UPI0031763D53
MSKSALMFSAALVLSTAAAPLLAQGHGLTPERGTEGLSPIVFDIENTGEISLSCGMNLAHWYSLELGQIAHGVTLRATFWSDPDTGAVVFLNPLGDQMPVERIWCGVAGRSWDTRFEMPFKRRAGEVEVDIVLACEEGPKGASLDNITDVVCTPR